MKARAVLLILILITLICSSCAANVTAEGFALGTHYSISAMGAFSKEKVYELLLEVENSFSTAIGDSDISRINAANADTQITVSEESMALIRDAFDYASVEGAINAFNPAIFPLVKLWGFAPPYLGLNSKAPPSGADVAQTLLVSDISMFSLDGNTVTKASSLAALDLGGIAKGYAADKIARYFDVCGVKSALIDVGGTLISYGRESVIGIKPPRESAFYYVASFTLSKGYACATSGDYERFFVHEDKRYHHIIGQTGYPADNGLIAVTVVASSAKEADALSTMAFVAGADNAPMLLRAAGAKGALITCEYEIISVDLDLTLKDGAYTLRSA